MQDAQLWTDSRAVRAWGGANGGSEGGTSVILSTVKIKEKSSMIELKLVQDGAIWGKTATLLCTLELYCIHIWIFRIYKVL